MALKKKILDIYKELRIVKVMIQEENVKTIGTILFIIHL